MKKLIASIAVTALLLGTSAAIPAFAQGASAEKSRGAIKLAKPKNLSVTPAATSVSVAFSNVPNASSYTVRVYPSSTEILVGPAHTNFNSGDFVTGLSPMTKYKITITAIGNGTTYSNSDESDAVRTTTLVLDCAHGGACVLGDAGPGGGKVFLVSPGFTEIGAPCNTSCHYLEVAPRAGVNAWTDTTYQWSLQSGGGLNTDKAIGYGYQNSLILNMFDFNTPAGRAVALYRGPNNKFDWFIPSLDEMSLLISQRAITQPLDNTEYWTSSQEKAPDTSELNRTWTVHTDFWGTIDNESWNFSTNLLPIRAF